MIPVVPLSSANHESTAVGAQPITVAQTDTEAAARAPNKTLRAISQRHYTVGYINVRHQDKKTLMTKNYSKHPALHIKGDWLSELGFTTGQPVTITTQKGMLIVELDMQV